MTAVAFFGKLCPLAVYRTVIPAEPKRAQAFRIILKGMVIKMIRLNCECQTELFTYEALSGTTCAVTGLCAAAPICLSVPAFAPDGRVVVAIADTAFSGCSSLRTVSLPDSVTSIGRRAFAFCVSLLDIRLSRNSALASIGDRAFIGCERLSCLRLEHLKHLTVCGKSAFAHCTHLRHVVLPESLSELPRGMFEGCCLLTNVRLPASLIRIGASAFASCGSLTVMDLPEHLLFIDENAFAWCAHLRELHLPETPCFVSPTAFLSSPRLPDLLDVG